MPSNKTYVVEHLDPELGSWSALEYSTIAKECASSGATFCIKSVSKTLTIPRVIQDLQSAIIMETRGIEELYENKKDRICLLDPAARTELSPDDESLFDVFLFGGIIGSNFLSPLLIIHHIFNTCVTRDSSRSNWFFQGKQETIPRVVRFLVQQKFRCDSRHLQADLRK